MLWFLIHEHFEVETFIKFICVCEFYIENFGNVFVNSAASFRKDKQIQFGIRIGSVETENCRERATLLME